MEPSRLPGSLNSFQMANSEHLCLDLLSTQAVVDPLCSDVEMERLSAHAVGVDPLCAEGGMDLLSAHAGASALSTEAGMDRLSAHCGDVIVDPLSTEAGMGLLSLQADVNLLAAQASNMDILMAQADMDLLAAQANLGVLPVPANMGVLPTPAIMSVSSSCSVGAPGYSMELQPPGESLLTQSERERQKTQDSLSILGDPDSLELSKAQVEQFYNQQLSGASGPSTDFPQGGCQGYEEATFNKLDPGNSRLAETQDESGEGRRHETTEEQMDVAHEDSPEDMHCETTLAACDADVRVRVPSSAGEEGAQIENDTDIKGGVPDLSVEPKEEHGLGSLDDGPEGSITITDARAQPVSEPNILEDGSLDIGGDLPVEGSLSSLSFTAKPDKSLEEGHPSIEDTTGPENVPTLRPRHGKMTWTSSGEAEQQLDEDHDAPDDDPRDTDFDPSRPRRSLRVLRPPPHKGPAGAAPAPQTASSQPSPAQGSRQTGEPPPRPGEQSGQPPTLSCANCQEVLRSGQTAYQRRGLPQLFCSSNCLSSFGRKPPKKNPCFFCTKDMANNKNPTLAQIGQSFKEFCNNTCLSSYEASVEKTQAARPPERRCSVCHQNREIIHEVSTGNMVHLLCSNTCFNTFRATKGLKTSCCDACGTYINMLASRPEYMLHEGQQRRFCNAGCLRVYKMKHMKVQLCQWCKTFGQNFEMLPHVDSSGNIQLFCSMGCITSYKVKVTGNAVQHYSCSLCKRNLQQTTYYCRANKTVYAFCSPGCWTKFQSNNPNGLVYLNCHACHNMFRRKPEILEWQDSVYQFCGKECCEDYKSLNGIVAMCEQCKREKVLHEKLVFSGVEKTFCSTACGMLYKQDFTQQLGMFCGNCSYCTQTCFPTVTEERDGHKWSFCSVDCKRKYLQWYLKLAQCQACQRQGVSLREAIRWRRDIKHFCNQQCLLHFYSQQAQAMMKLPHRPERLLNSHSPGSKSPPTATRKTEAPGRAQSGPVCGPAATSLPPRPVPQKNKSSMCKPMVATAAVTCKPEMKSQSCQTDDYLMSPPLVLPIPVPVYVPLPLQMYCQYTPLTMTWPLPLPVPVFLPSTLDQIVETIKELKLSMPSKPVKADIMNEAEAQSDTKPYPDACDGSPKSERKPGTLLADCSLSESAQEDMLSPALNMADLLPEPGQPLEDEHKAPLDLNPSVDFLYDCGIVDPPPILPEPSVAAQKGPKRQAISETTLRDPLDGQPVDTGLDSACGVRAWRSWVRSKHSDAEGKKEDNPFEVNEDPLLCSPAELNQGLSQFVLDVVAPRGPCYRPDSVFYLCLGIQQHLLENNRMVNIFTDQLYGNFAKELNVILSGWLPTITSNGGCVSRVLEEHLWECKQLGVYSPFVLLNTLMFFNTKFFGLRKVEQHLQLSFDNVVHKTKRVSAPHTNVVKAASVCYQPKSHPKKASRDSSLGKRKRDEPPEMEQQENRMNPLRCPVKFFEFYLSKCPNSVLNSPTSIYLFPERTCTIDSHLWYSDTPMDRGTLGVMLNRILAVRDISGELSEHDDIY